MTPSKLKEYLRSSGWKVVEGWAKKRQYVLANDKFPMRQISFPMDDTAVDIVESITGALQKLADLEGRTTGEVSRDIRLADDDAISFRISSPVADKGYLSLAFAQETIVGARQMLLASASSVLHPQVYHPRLGRAQAQELLDKTRFHHTERGSFCVKVSCPLHAIDDVPLLSSSRAEPPFVRRVVSNLLSSTRSLVSAVENDDAEALVARLRTADSPELSSNLCDALMHFGEDVSAGALEIEVLWASSLLPSSGERRSKLRVQPDYFPRIEEIGRELRASDQPIRDTFVGTVERLDGEMGEDGKRSGDVVLSLLLRDGNQVRAMAVFTSEQYSMADQAHMKDGTFVVLQGWLHPGRQPRQLTGVENLLLIERPQ